MDEIRLCVRVRLAVVWESVGEGSFQGGVFGRHRRLGSKAVAERKLGREAQRRLHEMLAAEPKVDATTIQTVGGKGYDGFTVAVVTASG